MKKIISLFILLFAFSFSVNAQEVKKDNVEISAKKDTKALTDFITLDNQTTEAFYGLFLYKHKMIANGIKEDKEKADLANIITKKIEATLSPEQFSKLSKNKELLENLTH
jgi:hypothetical protein